MTSEPLAKAPWRHSGGSRNPVPPWAGFQPFLCPVPPLAGLQVLQEPPRNQCILRNAFSEQKTTEFRDWKQTLPAPTGAVCPQTCPGLRSGVRANAPFQDLPQARQRARRPICTELPFIPRETTTQPDDSWHHLPRNQQANVLDSIHDRCYPKNLKKAVSYHLANLFVRSFGGCVRNETTTVHTIKLMH